MILDLRLVDGKESWMKYVEEMQGIIVYNFCTFINVLNRICARIHVACSCQRTYIIVSTVLTFV